MTTRQEYMDNHMKDYDKDSLSKEEEESLDACKSDEEFEKLASEILTKHNDHLAVYDTINGLRLARELFK